MVTTNYDSGDETTRRKSRFVYVCFPQYSGIRSLERVNLYKYQDPRYITSQLEIRQHDDMVINEKIEKRMIYGNYIDSLYR